MLSDAVPNLRRRAPIAVARSVGAWDAPTTTRKAAESYRLRTSCKKKLYRGRASSNLAAMTDHPVGFKHVHNFLSEIAAEDVHAKRILSIANASLGVIHAGVLAVHAIGHGLAQERGLNHKHAIKQVDRLLSNTSVDPWEWFALWVPYAIGPRTEVTVAMDWTDFENDDQVTIAINLITSHGRATPLLWKTVYKSALRGWQNDHQDAVLKRLKEVLPEGVNVTVLADRGFGDHKLYRLLEHLGFDYVIRFRERILVTDESGVAMSASDWVPKNGRPRLIRKARVTGRRYRVGGVVCVKAPKMKEAWCLACSESVAQSRPSEIVKQYGKRFSIEENFRDTKDIRFGMGLSSTTIGNAGRRDRMLLLSAIAVVLITLLGAAGESLGMERMLKANTSKERTYSLFRQGLLYYGAIPNMPQQRLEPLINRYAELLCEHQALRRALGFI